MKCLAVCRREEKVTPTPHFFPRASIFTACYGCWLSPNIFTLAVSSSERALPTVEPKEWDLGSNSIKQKRDWFPHAIASIYRKLSHRSPKVWGRLTAANREFFFCCCFFQISRGFREHLPNWMLRLLECMIKYQAGALRCWGGCSIPSILWRWGHLELFSSFKFHL